MDSTRLVHMANQIADFFKSYPEEEAIAGVENHIRQFWDPRMRTAFLHHLNAGGSGLNPISLAAAQRLKATTAASS